MNLESLHDFLRAALPASERELLADILRLRAALSRSYAGFPENAAELSDALRQLEGKRLLRKDGAEWKWLSGETVAVDRQGALFA